MSIGGPCLWVSSLSSPVPSLSAVTSHFSSAYHGDRFSSPKTVSPLRNLQKDREQRASGGLSAPVMQSAGVKAENALTTSPMPGSSAGLGSYPEGEILSRGTDGQRSAASREALLPRVKLEIPGDRTDLSMSQQVVSDQHGEPMSDNQMDFDKEDPDRESTISPSDERGDAVGSDEDSKVSSLEKKKMKRFRLTHNQTRFLMSEFTRQAHPDAAHRERLSREIPGLTPRQVQVWFQNRRAKLKRLTTNDRERVLKSRALPDDFDTTKVLRTPFESKSTGPTPIASPHDYGVPNPDFAALRTLRTDCFPRHNEDDYLVSPLSSASTAGTYMSSAGQGRNDGLSQPNIMFSRPAASTSMHDLHRTIRSDYSITRSNSLSDAPSQQPSFHAGYPLHNRFAAPSNPPSMPYGRQTMDYGVPRSSGMVTGYEQHQSFEGSVSPTDSQNAQITYDMGNLGTQSQNYQSQLAMSTSKDYSAMGISSQIPAHGRPMPTLQSLPVSAAQEYRSYPYGNPSVGTIPYSQANNTSTLNLPTTFAPSNQGATAHDQMQQHNPQTLESMRSKFGNPSFNYANYIQQ
ncbi:uncharacterized protein N7484_011724 [Penicillium longicatenatum]|uniref:uncharacterized protein n=1 Tax=Penicillium longicatenatum TaxID=1561947 RepID=UPI0025482CE3|nr:uncharacterized protein N7484_011724 [Penicillium longicatenatum]KAJ5631624.1 hypothetical protein N7484_011724 [Penicillium longicatenatum]